MARGIIRVESEIALVAQLVALDEFIPHPGPKDKTRFMVVHAESWTSRQLPNERLVVVGTPDGAFEREGAQKGAGPGTDAWTIACGAVCVNIKDPIEAKTAVQDALNAIGDELARDHRLGMTAGVQETSLAAIDGPYFAFDDKRVPTAWVNFDVSCTAIIRRNPT